MLPLMFVLNLSFVEVFCFCQKKERRDGGTLESRLQNYWGAACSCSAFAGQKLRVSMAPSMGPSASPARGQQVQEFWRIPLQIRLRFNECSFYQFVTGPIVETHIAEPVGQNQLRCAAC